MKMLSAEVFTVNKIHFVKRHIAKYLVLTFIQCNNAPSFHIILFFLPFYLLYLFSFRCIVLCRVYRCHNSFLCFTFFFLSSFQRAILRHQQNTWLTYTIIHYIKSVSSQPIYNHFTYKINQLTFILSYNLRDAPKAFKINQQMYLCKHNECDPAKHI